MRKRGTAGGEVGVDQEKQEIKEVKGERSEGKM